MVGPSSTGAGHPARPAPSPLLAAKADSTEAQGVITHTLRGTSELDQDPISDRGYQTARPNAEVTELKRQLKAERLADYITRTVDVAPALSAEQRDRLSLLLRGGNAA